MASMLYQHLPQIVGVVGAGQMGSGIAQVLASKGLQVILADRSAELVAKGVGHIEKALSNIVKKGTMTQGDADDARGRITSMTGLEVRPARLRDAM
jgi:3-hydroxybutyryl-CoA dehydrogenase